jgi:hypothetical protein
MRASSRARVARSAAWAFTSRSGILATVAVAAFGCRTREKSTADSPVISTATPVAAPPASPWTVTDAGAGALRIGMTRDQLSRDLHAEQPTNTSADSGCAYFAVPGIPKGMRTMWVAGTLARIEILAPGLATDRGAQVGDAESRIDAIYQGSVTSMPAKYDPQGRYLVIRPSAPADSLHRLVFETDSTHRVTRYRVGREPEVEWVEGCS